MGCSVVHIDEIEGTGPGNAVKFVRRRLGVEAFGSNWFEIPPAMESRFPSPRAACSASTPRGNF